MNPITAEWHSLTSLIGAAGVPATVDPGALLGAITSDPGGVAVLLLPPDPEELVTLAGDYRMSVPVVLATHGPNDHAAVERLHDRIAAVLAVALPSNDIARDPWDAGDGPALPAQRWTTQRRIRLSGVAHG